MANFDALKEQVIGEVEKVIDEAKAHEPAIEDALIAELGKVGVPSSIASAVGALAAATAAHFKATAPAAPAAAVDPTPFPAATAS